MWNKKMIKNIPKGTIISSLEITEKIPYDFVLYGLQRGEIGVLYGAGAVGKGYFLKHFFTKNENLMFEKQIKILYLSLEDDYISITNKYTKMDICHKKVDFGFDLDTEKHWENYDLIIIDTWSRYLGGRFEENSNKEMGAAYEEIIGKAKKYNVAVLVVAHTNKSGRNEEKEGSVNDLRGASVLSDNARLCISLEKVKNKEHIKANTSKINRKQIISQIYVRGMGGDLILKKGQEI
jgi:hypothetical protein